MELTSARRPRVARPTQEEGVCQTLYVDEKRVAAVQSVMPEAEVIQHVADLFSALSDPTRVKILFALTREELCVCDLAKIVERSMGATSHQLQLLRRLGVVKYRMAGKLAYYTLANPRIARLLDDAVRRAPTEARP